MSTPGPAAAAEKLDQLVRKGLRLNLFLVPAFLLAALDLATGWPGLSWRTDVAVLVGVAGELYALVRLRRTARRIRSGELSGRPTRRHWIQSISSLLVIVALSGGVGYLVGGWIVALLLPLVTIVLSATGILLGVRRRRQLRASRTTSP